MGESNLTKALVCQVVDNIQNPIIVIHTALQNMRSISILDIATSGYMSIYYSPSLVFYLLAEKLFNATTWDIVSFNSKSKTLNKIF